MMPGSKSTPDDNVFRLPRRGGEYHLEECSLGCDRDGDPKLFDDPTIAAIRLELKFAYVIAQNETDPEIDKIYWRCADNNVWEEILIGPIHHTATDLIAKPERWEKFLTYAKENSVEIPRKTIADYVRESQRRQAA